MIGKTLAHFKISGKLGEGGMGEVFRAEDIKLGREVAIKVLPSEVASDAERRARFEREAKAVAALNHPNIVTVFSIEEHEGTHFIAMELVEGQSFSELIPRDGYSTNKLLTYAIDIADAVASAHKKGITHRDLKPDNLMLDNEGRVKVMDFGLAKLEEGSIAASGSTEMPTESVTQEGKVLGTVAYMSPEQAEGKPVDARSDVFSLGVVLYEMATGKRPFQGDTSISTITAILRDNPDSVTNLNPRLPRHLGRVIRRCLTKDPDRRYQSALDLRNELEELNRELKSGELDSDTSAAVAELPPPRKSKIVPLLGALVAILVLVVGYLGYQQISPKGSEEVLESTQHAAPLMNIQQLTNTGRSTVAAISPDAKYVMHVVAEAGEESLWLRQVSTDSDVQVVPPAAVTYRGLEFSADGEGLYFTRQEMGSEKQELFAIPILGGTPTKVVDEDYVRDFAVSKDGTRIVFYPEDPENPAQASIAIMNLENGDTRTLLTKIPPKEMLSHGMTWSTDGDSVVYAAGTAVGSFRVWLEAVDVETGAISRIGNQDMFIHDLEWLPGASELVVAGSPNLFSKAQIWAIGYPDGAARQLTRDLSDYNTVSLSADGRSLVPVVFEQRGTLWKYDIEGESEGRYVGDWTGILNGAAGLASSPSGQIVFTVGTSSGTNHLWVANSDGSDPRPLIEGGSWSFYPTVCGDSVIATVVPEDQSVNLWRVGLDGSALTRLTDGSVDFHATCTHDDSTILYTSLETGSPAIWRGSLDGGATEKLSITGAQMERFPELSPDGRYLAFQLFDPEAGRWVGAIADRGSQEILLRIDDVPAQALFEWRPDSRGVAFSIFKEGAENVYLFPVDGTEPTQITNFTNDERIRSYAWLPDGNSLILSRGTDSRDVVLITDFR